MDHFHYENNVYHSEEVSLEKLANEVGTPFYCYSSATLARHYHIFSTHFPGAKICFAVKSNSNLAVLKTLARMGAGADVVSEGEIRLALAAGITPQNIVFSGVGKTAAEMAFALSHNIFQFNIESEPELELLHNVAMQHKVRARIAIRINPDVDPATHAKISTGHGDTKFGVPMEQALPLFVKAASLSGIEVQGVSVHIGSQLTTLEPFAAAFSRVRRFVQELTAQGISIKVVDLGGGLGIPYDDTAPPLPDAYAKIVQREMAGLPCQLVFEPGRMLVGNAGVLVTRVIYVKKSGSRTFVIVDAAMNDLIRPALYGAFHDIIPLRQPLKDAPVETVDIVGPVCETGDIFAENRRMPLPQAGDLLVIRSAGAYGAVMSSTYNARLLVPEVMVQGKKHALIRRRQTYDELLAQSRLPDWLA